MVGHLLSLGFKEKTIFRIAVIGDGIGRKLSDGSKQKWNFHIATGIILENSEMWIFDLLLSPDKLLSKEAWLKLSQLNNPKDRLILSYPDQSIPINAKIEFPHSFKGYTVFMSHNMNILSVKSLHIPCRQSIASFISSTIKVHALISGQKITKDSIAALFQKTPNVAAFMIEALFPAPSGEPPKLTPPPGLPLYPTSGCVI